MMIQRRAGAPEERAVPEREVDGVHDGPLAVLKAAHVVPLGPRAHAGRADVRGCPLAQQTQRLVQTPPQPLGIE
eukprot:scaffold134637_cov24-Prasinocladus_malaysianus.AAC.1